MRPWRQAKPGSKVTSGLKPVGVWNERLYGGRDDHSNARYRYQPPHVLVTFCLNDNRTLELIDPLLRPLNLIVKFAESEAGRRRQANVLLVTHDLDQCRSLRRPVPAIMPSSDKWARRSLMTCVRCRTRSSRVFNTIAAACWSADLTGTNRIVLRITASQIASASAASVLPRFTNGF